MAEFDEEPPSPPEEKLILEEEVSPEEEEEHLFRETALKVKTDPEQLGELLVVVNPASWYAMAGVLSVLAIAVLWAFFGSIPIRAEGRGIFIGENGTVTVQALIDGIVQKIYVKPGDYVKKGTLMVEVYDPNEDLKLKSAEIKVANLTRDLKSLQEEIAREEAASISSIKSDLTAKEYTIKQKEIYIEGLQKDYEKKKGLYKEGLISSSELRDTERQLLQEKIDIEIAKANVETLKGNLLKGYRTEEYKAKADSLLRETQDRDLLKTKLEDSRVYSPINGRVLEMFAGQGDLVTTGHPLVWVETVPSPENPLKVQGFFPLPNGKNIVKGQRVKIAFSTSTATGVVYIEGTVREVSEYAVSSENILRLFHSKALGEFLTSGAAAVISADIDLDKERNDTLGKISTGTVCTLQAVVSRVRPIYYLLPMEQFKQK